MASPSSPARRPSRASGGAVTDGRDARWAEHRIARRRELVEASLRAIRRCGHSLGMDDIAAEAGTSKTVIYRHLGDRLGLYLAVCESVDALILGEVINAVNASAGTSEDKTVKTGADAIVTVIDSYLALVERDPEVYQFVVRRPQVALSDESDPVTGLSSRIADALTALLIDLEPGMSRARAVAISWGLVGMVKESADRWLEDPEDMSRQELASVLAEFASAGLTASLKPAN